MRLTLPLLSLLVLAGVQTSPAHDVVDAGTSPVIRGDGLKRTVTCNRGRVTVDGRRNEVVMRGPCERVAIHGQGHRVAIEQVGTLSLIGSDHHVQWVRGIDGKQPRITDGSSGSTVDQITAQDFAALPVPTSRE